MNLEELLNNKKLDVLQILFNAIAEDLAIITKDDKSNLEIVDSQLNYQYQKLKEEFQKSRFEHKDKIAKYFTAYMDMYDEIIAYYNQKYFKERSKNWNKINGRSNKIKLKVSVK